MFADWFSSVFTSLQRSIRLVIMTRATSFIILIFHIWGCLEDSLWPWHKPRICGPNSIPSSVMKHFYNAIHVWVFWLVHLNLLKMSVQTQVCSQMFSKRFTYIVPFHKSRAESDVSNFRPIVIHQLVVIWKVFKKLVLPKGFPLLWHLISSFQHEV